MADVTLKCHCGRLRGLARGVTPKAGNRLVCYCDDCQAFARHLGQETVLDAYGGTDIFQFPPAQIEITAGRGQLRCLQLGPKGPHRWFADCCKTPLANSVSAGLPLVGVIHAFMDDEGKRDQLLGPVRYHVQGRFAKGQPPVDKLAPGFPAGMMIKLVARLAWLRFKGKHQPNPFYDDTGRPIVPPLPVKE